MASMAEVGVTLPPQLNVALAGKVPCRVFAAGPLAFAAWKPCFHSGTASLHVGCRSSSP